MKTIEIKYQDVKNDVLRQSEYIGQKAGQYDRLRAVSEDDEQLKVWYVEGLTLASVILDRLIAKKVTRDTSDNAQFTLLNDNDNAVFVEPAVRRLIVCHIISRWLKLVAPQMVEAYQVDVAQAQDELYKLVYYREMPL